MISRRAWLVMAAGAGVGLGLLPWARIRSLPPSRWFAGDAGIAPGLESVLQGLDGTAEVGRRWIEESGAGVTLPALLERIEGRLGAVPAQRQAVEARLADLVRQDYAEGRLCEVDDWLLSRTECELAGLRWLTLGSLSAVRSDRPAGEPEAGAAPVEGEIVEVSNWGPRSTEAGSGFNVQHDGHSGWWFVALNAPTWVQILVDGKPIPTTVHDQVITSALYADEIGRVVDEPGIRRIDLLDPVAGVVQFVGEFEVRERAHRYVLADGSRAASLCPIGTWGPERSRAGVPENPQPDGSMGMWFHAGCTPESMRLLFGDDPLPVTRVEFGFTVRVPLALIETPGEVLLRLRDVATGEEMPVGRFVIEP